MGPSLCSASSIDFRAKDTASEYRFMWTKILLISKLLCGVFHPNSMAYTCTKTAIVGPHVGDSEKVTKESTREVG